MRLCCCEEDTLQPDLPSPEAFAEPFQIRTIFVRIHGLQSRYGIHRVDAHVREIFLIQEIMVRKV